MNHKTIVLGLAMLFLGSLFAQEKRTIKVIVPNKTDEVFITGNQESLGNWNPGTVKLNKVSDFEREITLDLTYPAEFKFTKGNWNSEGIVKQFNDNPNLKLENDTTTSDFIIKTWSDNIDAQKLGLNYDIRYIHSEYMNTKRLLKIALPMNYDSNKAYPVIYVTDAQSANFQVTKSYVNALSQTQFNMIPECIVVGIYQTQRNDDFYGIRSGKYFTEFLIEEVVPYIDNNYSTSGFNTMVGHSNGAEYNHKMMLNENNPFRGFISMSTWLEKKEEVALTSFLNEYNRKTIYYYLANATLDGPGRTAFGNDLEKICKDNPNENFKFIKNTVEGDHQTMVPNSLLDGLKFIFQDYSAVDGYDTIMDFDKNYLSNVKETYGVDAIFTMDMMGTYWMDITNKKSKEEWEYYVDFVNREKLFYGKNLDFVNIANGYFSMDMYAENIEAYNKAIEDIDNCEDIVFYLNIHRPITSYIKEGKAVECISFLERARSVLPKEYYLGMTYHIAKVSLENKVELEKGKEALAYCKDNYKKNSIFTEEELETLR
ncbi:alpha/beta hydrolase-fold protein [Winogradskyella aquimaris]|uniref:Alpha/beta hydrolase-fold protein n=1 Tax=Winogradskyella aquimaris TaxID=864074 RepID=A0ABU5EPD7_9FLAO|nr:alpha/beta hydrolase-fold protein [Winogradskyella aquimaris]MDY2588325.1 alpha/beta hydrolase-fold protein [Winogradskyella aquimaris]